jgi:uncharacterized membrane protein
MPLERLRRSRSLFNLVVVIGCCAVAMLVQSVTLPAFLRLFLVLPLLGFVPGYALMGALFPASQAMRMSLRGGLAVLLSLCIVPAVATILDRTAWGIRPLPVIISLMVLSVCAVLIGWWTERRLGRLEPAPLERGQKPIPWFKEMRARGPKAGSVLLVAVVVTGVFWTLLAPSVAQPFTEFFIEPEDALVLSASGQGIPAGLTMLPFTVVNHENRARVYSVEMVVDGASRHVAGPVRIEDGKRWQTMVPVSRELEAGRRVDLYLLREGDRTPYRMLHVWLGPAE